MRTTTNSALLEGLRDPQNQTVWRLYVNRYRPLIAGYARKLGLPGDDAEDAAQETPKILDFGIARATGTDLQRTMIHTEAGQIIGTLSYMSREQIRGNPSEVDVRSDVYALGVVLFELLTGALPLDLEGMAPGRSDGARGQREGGARGEGRARRS